MFDTPAYTDNRSYDYSQWAVYDRPEYPIIAGWVPQSATVLDLGCGNGSLLAFLRKTKQTQGFGLDVSATGIEQCEKKGIRARCGRIDEPLVDVGNDKFDIAICNVTLQMVMYPEILLSEMCRVAAIQIVSFANFAEFRNRMDLLLAGRMPRPMLYGYTWYNTGHIHQLSLADFYDICSRVGLRVLDTNFTRSHNIILRGLCRLRPNLFSSIPLLRLGRTDYGDHS